VAQGLLVLGVCSRWSDTPTANGGLTSCRRFHRLRQSVFNCFSLRGNRPNIVGVLRFVRSVAPPDGSKHDSLSCGRQLRMHQELSSLAVLTQSTTPAVIATERYGVQVSLASKALDAWAPSQLFHLLASVARSELRCSQASFPHEPHGASRAKNGASLKVASGHTSATVGSAPSCPPKSPTPLDRSQPAKPACPCVAGLTPPRLWNHDPGNRGESSRRPFKKPCHLRQSLWR
jgi:hypothetical protein